MKIEIQIFFHKLASIDFEIWLSKIFGIQWKSHFFKKKSKKVQISKFRPDRKKKSEKKSSSKFLYPLGESMFKKSAKLEMVTGRLVDSYKKKFKIFQF
jgi:hypothetical protein